MSNRAIRLMDASYEVVEDGYKKPEPIIHLFGRDEWRNRRHVKVDGFYPYFCTTLEEALEHSEELSNDHRVRRVVTEEDGEPIESINGVRLAKIVVIAPYHVSDLRENFNETWEADILFPDRFAYDTDIVDTFIVHRDEDIVHYSDIEAVETVDVPPRVCYVDIEVEQTADGPSVVSKQGKELADNPISAITAYDNYLNEYRAFILQHDTWTDEDVGRADAVANDSDKDVTVSTYDNERALLSSYASYMEDRRFDVATAWNMGFDFPYLVNRYFTLDHMDVFQLSDTRQVESMDGSGRFINGDIEGLLLFDLLEGFKKASIHELDDNSLETVAAAETDIEKLDIGGAVDYSEDDPYQSDIDKAWETDPQTFVSYSIRDVLAMERINSARGILT